MPLRPATRADIPVMGKIFAAAFAPDSLFHVLFPYKAEHPEGFERAAREVFWYHWYDYRMVHILSYQLVDDNEQSDGDERSALLPSGKKRRQKEIITGVAQWERTGKGWEKLYGILGWWDPRLLMKHIVGIYFALRQWVVPNRAERQPTASAPDPLTIRNFIDRLIPLAAHLYEAPHRQVRWGLEVLVIDPAHQGKGFGKELVKEGLTRAKNDPEGDLPVVVVSATNKERFYQANGFGDIEGWMDKVGGEQNPLYRAGQTEGGAVMWTK